MEDGYYDDLCCSLHDLADELAATINPEELDIPELATRLRKLAGPDIREFHT